MGYRAHTLEKGLEIIAALLKGPYTVKELAVIVGLHGRTIYRYIKTINKYMPVQSAKRKLYPKGIRPRVFWIE